MGGASPYRKGLGTKLSSDDGRRVSAKIRVVEYCLRTVWTAKLSVIRSSGMSAVQGCLSIEVNGRTVGTFRIVRHIVGVRC